MPTRLIIPFPGGGGGSPPPPPSGGAGRPTISGFLQRVVDDFSQGFNNFNFDSVGQPRPSGYVNSTSRPGYWGIYNAPGSEVRAVTFGNGAKALEFFITRDAAAANPDPNGARIRASAILLDVGQQKPGPTFQTTQFVRVRMRIPASAPVESEEYHNRHNLVENKGGNGAGIQPQSLMREGEKLKWWRYWSFDNIKDSTQTPPPNGGFEVWDTGVAVSELRVASDDPSHWPDFWMLYRPGLGSDATMQLWINGVLRSTRNGPNNFAGYSATEASVSWQADFHAWPWLDGPSESATRTLQWAALEYYIMPRTWNP